MTGNILNVTLAEVRLYADLIIADLINADLIIADLINKIIAASINCCMVVKRSDLDNITPPPQPTLPGDPEVKALIFAVSDSYYLFTQNTFFGKIL